ncbi:DNA repair protein RecO [Fructilactobacillus sanfranciscensis]|uniref:DNA repair protein RecO n=1 Tax=Fructilactobacillus sanfranciscensis TaxID=1625 RepID=UPI000A6E04BD|nr:DNA repair protein RecO [Fructilactobacillus sanfranciscensis]MCG7195654.1 DNA repair protein RecO [Fructilactobacillus sanfranciscensis]MVF15041.1 DNA repair protein RecO [Fructilactobacillus sanfranciscensis]NDR76950.1 DNA repair protein RecO [Fructilactobacillus sanfranciscensis]QFX94003.1 DNA repair protein RecO [Fructilactobacillus sanfranciscensis]RDX59059.1 DNA repair protein RecO [Fructilactobacillus sanfranciscensis]
MVNTKSKPFHGILIYRKNYRENDMLVKFFTAEAGKKMFFVRGANRPKFKMISDILPFSYGTYEGELRGNGLSYIDSGGSVKHFDQISEDIYLNGYATYLMGLIDAALPDNVPNKIWFDKLFYALNLINNGFDAEIITNIFEIQLLPLFGVAPDFKNCAVCHEEHQIYDYSEKFGGLIGEQEFAHDSHRMHLDQRTIYYLRLFSAVDITKINNIKVNRVTKQKLRQVIDKIYDNSVGLNLKSKKFLDQMNSWKIKLN